MINFQEQNTYFVSCPPECEKLLEDELQNIGAKEMESTKGGVFVKGTLTEVFPIILHSRIASRVYLELKTFKFKEEKQIANKAFAYDWSDIFSVHQTFKVTSVFDRGAKKKFSNSLYCAQLVKDGIVDQFNKVLNKRPSVDTQNADFNFSLRVEATQNPELWQAKISLDLTGFPLSNRGYRLPGHSAPLRENLAAAIVKSIEFDPENEIFMDTMSGTGTLLIEAMLAHLEVSPSFLWLKRASSELTVFKIRNLKTDAMLKKELYEQIQEVIETNELRLKNLRPNTYFAFDISNRYIDILKKTIAKTGLDWKKIRIVKKDAVTLKPPFDDAKGVVVANPPYGKRIGEVEELEDLYYKYGENLKNSFKGFKAYVFTSNPELRKKISLQTSQRIPFHNGDLECRLLRYNLY